MDTRDELRKDSSMTEQAYYECNHFQRMPEELMVLIFDRVADLKCLCRCSLVSKQFASVVSRVGTVSITITGSVTYDKEALGKMRNLVSELMNGHRNSEELDALLDSLSFQNMKLPVFLNKLTELKFVYLDYDYTRKSVSSCITMRKIKFCGNGSKIESFVAIDSLHMHKDTENKADDKFIVGYFLDFLLKETESWRQFCVRYTEWICFVIVLVKYHASPQRVTITDSQVHGKMVVGDEYGINLDMGVLDKLLVHFADFTVMYAQTRVLRLPLSGYGMKLVLLMIARLPESSGAHSKNVDEIEYWDIEDELPVFREAVKEFLEKHKDKLGIIDHQAYLKLPKFRLF